MGGKGFQQGVQQGLQRVGEGVGEGWCIESLRFSLPNFSRLSIGEADFASQPHSPNDDDVVVVGLGRWWGEGQQNKKLVSEILRKKKEQKKTDLDGIFVRSGVLSEGGLRS